MYRKTTGFNNPYSNDGSSVVESENDRLTSELKDKIKSLKDISIHLGDELKDSIGLLNNMDNDFEGAGGFLGRAMFRVKKLSKGSQNYVILYLFLFAMFIFLLIWVIIKF